MAAQTVQDATDFIKTLGRPPVFGGEEETWEEWSFVMKAYLCLLAPDAPTLIEVSEDKNQIQLNSDISVARIQVIMGDTGVTASRKIYYALVLGVKGPALTAIRGVEQYNGAMAWRTLVKRYAPSTSQQSQSLLHSILNAKQLKSTMVDYESGLAEWEELMRRYERASGEVVQESLKKTIFLSIAPSSCKTQLAMQNLATFDDMKGATLQYLRAVTKYADGVAVPRQHKRDPDALEVDALARPGAPGRGKGKDPKGKGKGDVSGSKDDWKKGA